MFPVLIPTLTAIPMTVFNARALASLVSVAGSALSRRLTVILGTLVKVMETQELEQDEELKSAVDEALQALLESISDAEGLNTLMLLLLGWYAMFSSHLGPSIDIDLPGLKAKLFSVVLMRAISLRHSAKLQNSIPPCIESTGSDSYSLFSTIPRLQSILLLGKRSTSLSSSYQRMNLNLWSCLSAEPSRAQVLLAGMFQGSVSRRVLLPQYPSLLLALRREVMNSANKPRMRLQISWNVQKRARSNLSLCPSLVLSTLR